MKQIKRIIFSLLNIESYLRLISKTFFLSFNLGLLRNSRSIDCHYFVRNFIKPGDTVIDLGANLGYYSVIFSKLVGNMGKVYSIEPVELFRKVFKANTRRLKNIEMLPYAIGTDDGKNIKMAVPKSSDYFSHGRTHVMSENETDFHMLFDATIRHPKTLFQKLEKLDYFKCDIEGYEGIAFPLFMDLFEKHRPIIQIELAKENREAIFALLENIGYKAFSVWKKQLVPVVNRISTIEGDVVFIPEEQSNRYAKHFADKS